MQAGMYPETSQSESHAISHLLPPHPHWQLPPSPPLEVGSGLSSLLPPSVRTSPSNDTFAPVGKNARARRAAVAA